MAKKIEQCKQECQYHTFRITPIQQKTYFAQQIEVSFCYPGFIKLPSYPHYNNDNKFYTPAFCLPENLPKFQSEDSFYKTEHNKDCQQLLPKSQLFYPKPKSRNQYCSVCKINYQDYYSHLKSGRHTLNLRKNTFTRQIEKMIKEKYPKKKVKKSKITRKIKQNIEITDQQNLRAHKDIIKLSQASPKYTIQLRSNKITTNIDKAIQRKNIKEYAEKHNHLSQRIYYPIVIQLSPSSVQ